MCRAQIRVNSRRAVSRSTSILPSSRSRNSSRSLVVQAAPAHVERLDLRGAELLDGGVVALADQEVVLHHLPERRQRQHDVAQLASRPHRARRTPGAARRCRCAADTGRAAPTRTKSFSSRRSNSATARSCSTSGERRRDGLLVQHDVDDAAGLATWRTSSASGGSAGSKPTGRARRGPRLRRAPAPRAPARRARRACRPTSEVRLRKSATPSPPEKRAAREVGSTWLVPAT